MNTDRRRVAKAWGYEDILVNTPLYCGKRMVVFPGGQCRWHYHVYKDETFYLVRGALTVEHIGLNRLLGLMGEGHTERDVLTDDRLYQLCKNVLQPGDAVRLIPGVRHRFTNHGWTDAEFYEFSTHHDDDDSHYPLGDGPRR